MISRVLSALLGVLALVPGAQRVVAGDWPAWRGPQQNGVSPEVDLPVRLDLGAALAYKVELPGRGLSCPIVAGGRVFLTASSGWRDDRLHVLAFDAASGRKLWERRFEATGSTYCHEKTCMAAPTPAWDGERLYALFATFDLFAFDAEGQLLWYRALGRDYPELSNQVGFASSPVPIRNALLAIFDTDSEAMAIAFDGTTGRNLWSAPRERGIFWASPLVVGSDPQIGLLPSPQGLNAREARTGRSLWTWAGKLDGIASPCWMDGSVYLPGGELVSLDLPGSNAEPVVRWKTNRLRTSTASPLVFDGKAFAINSAGVLTCASTQSGEILWQERLKGPFSASPVAGGGRIYCVNEEGLTFSLDPRKDPRQVEKGEVGETILASPAIANGRIFLRSDRQLFAFGKPGVSN